MYIPENITCLMLNTLMIIACHLLMVCDFNINRYNKGDCASKPLDVPSLASHFNKKKSRLTPP